MGQVLDESTFSLEEIKHKYKPERLDVDIPEGITGDDVCMQPNLPPTELELREIAEAEQREKEALQNTEEVTGDIFSLLIKNRISHNKNFMAVVVGSTGCLDGNTKIKVIQSGRIYYERLHDLAESGKRIITVPCYNFKERKFEEAVAEIIPSGWKDIWKINLSDGTSVSATEDHKFFLTNGKEITVKELIELNKPHKKGEGIRKRIVLASKNYPQKNENKFWNKHHTEQMRLKAHNREFKTGIRAYHRPFMLRNLKNYCEICNSKTRKLVVHHIDRNRYHNDYFNLMRLCFSCHALLHRRIKCEAKE
jgi:hypothetical protein